ncbi:hypothetical protein J2X01_000278 [Arthrobacter ginsengisoli]|uniref:Uncharacterized protein n=1 Tax=Arthrobacter ginsengisoli TaxID=1356565 RepID=A0ABU1U745_9MICC|nr:hypothetical protein [Arthrobacter ginsengisoli]MDR7081009.1 hypothetical protein [Arthrobacter ginsengisoli]
MIENQNQAGGMKVDDSLPCGARPGISDRGNGRLRHLSIAVVLAVGGVGVVSGTAQAAPGPEKPSYTAGAPGSGDAYFP